MIVLDIETSGLDSGKCGIWQIGALELENPKNYFIEEGRIDSRDYISKEALKVIGKTEKELRDKTKQSQKQLISDYLNWAGKVKIKITAGQNIGWDVSFLQNKCFVYGLMQDFRKACGQRTIDLHTIAQEKYESVKGIYLLNEKGKSEMDLPKVLEFCGIDDKRIMIENGKITRNGKSHEALEDCMLEGECVYRIKYGKNLLKRYSKFSIPEYLIKMEGRKSA